MWCLPKTSLHENCRMGRRIVVMKLICSLGHCECDGHTVHMLSQRRLTADWLAPLESDCSRMHSKISSDWLPSYIKATRPVLEMFKMAGYFPDSRRITTSTCMYLYVRLTLRLLMSYIYDISSLRVNDLTLILLTWRKWWANNASK